jgi:hypothetical protein
MVESRSEFLIKAHSLWLGDAARALPHFREQERHHQAHLVGYEASLAEILNQWGEEITTMNIPAFGDYLTVMRGVSYEREYLAWLRWAIAILEARAEGQA